MRLVPLGMVVVCAGCFGDASLKLGTSAGPAQVPVGPVGAPPVTPGVAQIRLLNAGEYKASVQDLLGLEASASITHFDRAGGYDTGAGAQVEANLFSALVTEGERLAGVYVETRLGQDFPCFDPANVTDACVDAIIGTLGGKAIRRPLGAAAIAEVRAHFTATANETGSRLAATQVVIARILTSPWFLYRREVGKALGPDPQLRTLDAYDRAAVVAYAVTGSTPDAELLADAAADRLDADHLRAHVRRLLKTPRGQARVVDFVKQWLRVKRLDDMAERPDAYPKLAGAAQARALKGEFEAFVGSVIFEGKGTLTALLTDSHTFVTADTAPLYGLTSSSQALTRVELNPYQRRGVLTLASTMAALGAAQDPTKDRPVVRGLLIKNQLLCEDVGAPSGVNTATAAGNVIEKYPDFENLTIREQYVAMMEQGEACATCHAKFMPMGFGFGTYDALGRWTTARKGRAIDATVRNFVIAGEARSYSGAVGLIGDVAQLPATSLCFIRNFLSFALGGPKAVPAGLAETLAPDFARTGDVKQLIEDALSSPHLYVRRAVIAEAQP